MKMIFNFFFFSPVELKRRGRAGKTSTLENGDTICPIALFEAQMCYKSDGLRIDCRGLTLLERLGVLVMSCNSHKSARGPPRHTVVSFSNRARLLMKRHDMTLKDTVSGVAGECPLPHRFL